MAVIAVRRSAIGKWTAYWLSLCLPGMGQLMAGSRWSVPWFAGIVSLWCIVNVSGLQLAAPIGVVFSVLLSLLSAEHAKRLLEPSHSPRVGRSKPRVRVRCMEVGREAVDLRIELFLDRPADEVWSEMADFASFTCIDPFHERVIVQAAEFRSGVDLILVHCIFGFRFLRFGRLLTWRNGHGYAFSDLSGRSKRHGFPHVFFYSVEPEGDSALHSSRLTVCVRGKWTAPWTSRRVGMWWLRYVCYEHARLLRKML
jgi:hypothetical protein